MASGKPDFSAVIERHTPDEGINATKVPSLYLFRSSVPFKPLHAFYEQSVCFVVQGKKSVSLGEEVLTYGTDQYLLVSVALPIISHVLEASAERPHLALHINIDPKLILDLVLKMEEEPQTETSASYGLFVGELDSMVSDAVERLVRLLDTPEHIDTLAPLILREIFYLLLSGSGGVRLRNTIMENSKIYRVSQAIQRLRQDYDQALPLKAVAGKVGMSLSSLHHQFKEVTGMTPLQFQKHIRLQEARRLMLSEGLTAESAGFQVGYGSASQFSREYRRMFGDSPQFDIKKIRANH